MRIVLCVIMTIIPLKGLCEDLIFKWSSFPNNVCTYELYITNGALLYLAKDGLKENEGMPYWVAKNLNDKASSEVIRRIREIVVEHRAYEAKKDKQKYLCEGFQWGIHYMSESEHYVYGGTCGKVRMYENINDIIEKEVKPNHLSSGGVLTPGCVSGRLQSSQIEN